MSSSQRFTSSPRSWATLVVLGAASVVVGCGPLPEEQGEPQFPRGEAVGMPGTPPGEQAAAYDVSNLNGVPYGPQAGEPASVVAGELPSGGDSYADTDPSALTDFHAALDPYGQWTEDPSYGTIWQPSAGVVGDDFAPYETAGHWSYGDDYVWVSDYSWGWAPFHYGRWVYATNGWGWIPGRQYAGAWTTWRTGYGAYGGYVGWAPLPPTYYWRGGVALGLGVVPPAAYGFCQTSNLFAPSLAGRMAGGPQVAALGQNSRPFMGAVPVSGHAGIGGSYGATSGGRTLAHPEVAGPSPQSLNISSRQVVRPPTNNGGLARASQFARPSTATALGGHAPAGWNGGRASGALARGAGAGRPYGSSMGTSAYGSYGGIRETRTIGGSGGAVERGAFEHPYAHSTGSFHGGGAVYGRPSTHLGHGLPAAPQYHPPQYGGGYHPSSSGGGGGGHFGGHGGGGGGGHGGGGHR